jgi:MFS family permease
LLGARLVYGIFAGGIQPAAQAYIADTTDAGSRAQGMALVAASGGIGTIIGPVFGGLLAEISPLFPMYAASALALCAALWAWFGLTEPARHVSTEPQARLRFTDQRIFPYLLGWFVIFMVFTGIQVVTAFFVKDQIGLDSQQAVIRATSIAMFCMALVTVIVQVVVLQVWKLPPKVLLRTSFILFGLVLLLLSQVQSLPMLFVTFALMGLGASLAMPSLSAAASIAVEPHEQGGAAGLLTAAPTLGMVFGPALGAILYQQGPGLPMLAGGALTILTGIYFWFVRIPEAPAAH